MPKSNHTEKSTDDNRIVYPLLLVTMLAMFVVQPFLNEHSVVNRVFYTVILIGAALGAIRSRERWIGGLILALLLIGFFWTEELPVLVLVLIAYLLTIGVFLRRVFSHGTVTSATVSGALCAYLMLGIAWMLAYMALLKIQPQAFRTASGEPVEAFYYSFVTLTTLGYGDITPVTKIAKNLSCLEALVGQIFLVAIVARLVGHLQVPAPPQKD